MSAHRFRDDLPLVGFTTLAILGGGILAAHLLVRLGGVAVGGSLRPHALAAGAMIASGMLLSTLHLGRPGRAPLALSGVRSSRLSREVALVSAAVPAAAVSALLPPGALATAAHLLAGGAGFLLLLAIGDLYALPAQPGWRGAVTRAPAAQGLAFGFVSLTLLEVPWAGPMAGAAAAFLVVDLLLRMERIRRSGPVPGAAPLRPAVWRRRTALLSISAVTGDVLPALALFVAGPMVAAAVFAAGMVFERSLFYLLRQGHSTEAEMAGVEARIGDASV